MSLSDFEFLAPPNELQRIGIRGEKGRALLSVCLFDVRLEHRVCFREILVGLNEHRQSQNAGGRDVSRIEQIVADLHDILAHGLCNIAGVDLEGARQMQSNLEFAVGRLLDFLGKQFGAARCREIRRRLMHVEIPDLLSGRLPTRKEHKSQRQTKCCGGRLGRSLPVFHEHGDPPFDIAGMPAIAETPFRCFCNNDISFVKRAYGHVIWLSTCWPSAAQTRTCQLVWRFRSPHHSCRESEMRTSEPKPH